MKIKRPDDAVSEIFVTILLLAIVVAVFSGISTFLLAPPSDSPQPFVTITGEVEGANITLMHRGGESLSLYSVLFVTIDNSTSSTTVGNCMDSISKDDGFWNIGEKLNYPSGIIANQEVTVTVTNVETNSVVFIGVFNEG